MRTSRFFFFNAQTSTILSVLSAYENPDPNCRTVSDKLRLRDKLRKMRFEKQPVAPFERVDVVVEQGSGTFS